MKNIITTASLFLALSLSPFVAHAEEEVFMLKPLHVAEDPNGVDLLSGTYRPQLPPLGIPAASNLTLQNIQKFQPQLVGKISGTPGSSHRAEYSLNYGRNTADSFVCIDYDCESAKGNGSTFRPSSVSTAPPAPPRTSPGRRRFDTFPPGNGNRNNLNAVDTDSSADDATTTSDAVETFSAKSGASGPSAARGVFHYQQGHTGLRIIFDRKAYHKNVNSQVQLTYYPSIMFFPSGESLSFSYDTKTVEGFTYHRPARITSSIGYELHLDYATNNIAGKWGTVTRAAIFKSDDLTKPIAYRSYTGTTTVTDEIGRDWQYTGIANAMGSSETSRDTTLRKPDAGVTSIDVESATRQYGNVTHRNFVTRVRRDDTTWNYNYTTGGSHLNPRKHFTRLRITGPEGYIRTLEYGHTPVNKQQYITSDTDSLGNTTSYTYDDKLRITSITFPERNSVHYTYDGRGNVTRIVTRPKPGSDLADIVEKASYPSSCSGMKCFRPTSSTDARGAVTHYSHSATHGGLTARTEPPDVYGLRRRTQITYESSTGLHRVKRTRTCSVRSHTQTCSGGNDLVTEYTYLEKTFLPLTVKRTNSSASIDSITRYSYDDAGRPLSADGPLPGGADTVFYVYDGAGRRTWEIGALNQAGTRVAKRIAYRDADNQPLVIDTGVFDTSIQDFARIETTVHNAYDAYGRKTSTRLETDSETLPVERITRSVKQFAYDDRNRLVCTAQRMNEEAFSGLPGACSLGPEGDHGPDRIVRTHYDSLSRIEKVVSGYRSDAAGVDVKMMYTPNGQVEKRTDGEGHSTLYDYDGFDRLIYTQFPDFSYELSSYDENGNLKTFQKRDGREFRHYYDARNLRTNTTVPNDDNLAFIYDGLGRPTETHQGDNVVKTNYDALGRLKSTTRNGRTLSYGYDLAGRRIRLTWPDGFHVNYDYDATGALEAINESSGAMLVGYLYDNLGRMTTLNRGNGISTDIGYDPLSRVNALDHAGINSTDFSYTPANRIASRTVSNAAYAHAMPQAGSASSYEANNLNQYTEISGAKLVYNKSGHLYQYDGWSYIYNAHNRMIMAFNDDSRLDLEYDPNGQLYKSTLDGITTEFLYDGDELVAEYRGNTLLRRYVHGAGIDDPQVQYTGKGTTNKRWLHADERGSIITETDITGTVVETHTYGVYGEPGNESDSRFRYTGQILLPGTKLYHYKARVYHPELGRFMQTDPIGYQDGMNMYAYVGNDPMNASDPTGLACTPLNSGSEYCSRATLYGGLDGQVGNQTRFFAAASATTQLLAGMDMPFSGAFVSSSTASFLSSLSTKLEGMNRLVAGSIQMGNLSGPGLDARIVRMEQNAVQGQLNALSASDPDAYKTLIGEMNSLLNPSGPVEKWAGQRFPTDKAYGRILDQVRGDLGRDIDFSKQGDREAIGNKVIGHIRKTGGCDVTGTRIKQC